MIIVWHAEAYICYHFATYFKRHACYQCLDINKHGWTCRKPRYTCVRAQGTNRHTQLLDPVCPQAREIRGCGVRGHQRPLFSAPQLFAAKAHRLGPASALCQLRSGLVPSGLFTHVNAGIHRETARQRQWLVVPSGGCASPRALSLVPTVQYCNTGAGHVQQTGYGRTHPERSKELRQKTVDPVDVVQAVGVLRWASRV
jgi:hypothetical protein